MLSAPEAALFSLAASWLPTMWLPMIPTQKEGPAPLGVGFSWPLRREGCFPCLCISPGKAHGTVNKAVRQLLELTLNLDAQGFPQQRENKNFCKVAVLS